MVNKSCQKYKEEKKHVKDTKVFLEKKKEKDEKRP